MKWILFLLFTQYAFSDVLHVTPTIKTEEKIIFSDDINFKNISKVISRQKIRFEQLKEKGIKLKFGDDVYTVSELSESLDALLDLSVKFQDCSQEECLDSFNLAVNELFNVYKPNVQVDDQGFGKDNFSLFTSYYSPDFEGSFVKTDLYQNVIYKKPVSSNGYPTRVEIDFDKVLENKGLELFYVKEPLFDLYLLHIEGGGRVKVLQEDGTVKYYYLSYSGNNGKKLFYIYKYMKEKGYLTDDSSISAQRDFLNNNPELQREIFETTPSYCFFKISEDEPMGVENIPLTEQRSAAVDRRHYPLAGLIMFVQADAPTESILGGESKPFSRFFLAQDTGGAIKGRARVDLYSGYGEEAELWANYLKSFGKLYFLALKK